MSILNPELDNLSAKEKHWKEWGISGMPADKIRLAEHTWEAAINSLKILEDNPTPPAEHFSYVYTGMCYSMAANPYSKDRVYVNGELAIYNDKLFIFNKTN
jgi:hypothetical protein